MQGLAPNWNSDCDWDLISLLSILHLSITKPPAFPLQRGERLEALRAGEADAAGGAVQVLCRLRLQRGSHRAPVAPESRTRRRSSCDMGKWMNHYYHNVKNRNYHIRKLYVKLCDAWINYDLICISSRCLLGLPRLLHTQSLAESLFGVRSGHHTALSHIFSQVRDGDVPLRSGPASGAPQVSHFKDAEESVIISFVYLLNRFFRVIPADTYLIEFSSDRRHMRRPDGSWIKPPPSYPPILSNCTYLG